MCKVEHHVPPPSPSHLDPLDALPHVLLLLLFQHQLYEELLQLLVAVVDTQLLKTRGGSVTTHNTLIHCTRVSNTCIGSEMAVCLSYSDTGICTVKVFYVCVW